MADEIDEDEFEYSEISRMNLYILYGNLGDPYDIVDEIRAENINNNIFDED